MNQRNNDGNPNSDGNTWERQIDEDGDFRRKPTSFHHSISESGPFEPEKNRYHLYVSYACPWAHRTLIVRQLKGLEDVISVDVVASFLPSTGWSFNSDEQGATGDRVNHFADLKEVYLAADSNYSGTITVPVLWDKKQKTIVNNESAEIIRLFNSQFNQLAKNPALDLYPNELAAQIDEVNKWIYRDINNGVYRCGFARTQRAYERAFTRLFAALDRAETILAASRYLTGERLTEADIRLFTTLVRFDAVYYVHFKTNLKRIVDYPALWRFVCDLYGLDGVAETLNMDHIKNHYYRSHTQINPFGIVPIGPQLEFKL